MALRSDRPAVRRPDPGAAQRQQARVIARHFYDCFDTRDVGVDLVRAARGAFVTACSKAIAGRTDLDEVVDMLTEVFAATARIGA